MPYDGDVVLKAALDATGVSDTLKDLKQTVSKGFRNFIRYGLGTRSVFALINKLRKALIEGFGDLAHVSDPFNQAMSNILNALAGLKASFSAAFAPIIQVVAPALVTFINLVSKAVDTVGMFIAALAGQSEYIKAIPVQIDYAQSLDKTGKNASDASKSLGKTKKAAKELEKTLAGFDDVEILKDNRNDDDDTSTSGLGNLGNITGGGTEAVKQSLTPLAEVFTDFAKKIKDAWKKADFTEIGRTLGTKLRNALKNIDWEKINKRLEKIAKSVATGLNGFLSTPGLFTTVGETLASAINAVFLGLQTFVSTFDWSALGTAIKDLLLGVLNNINWTVIYNTAATYASGIATTLNNVFGNQQVWDSIFGTFANGFNTVVGGINNFVTKVEWGRTAILIANALNNALLYKFNWARVGITLKNLINNAFTFWYNFVDTFDFSKFGTKIGTAVAITINGINWFHGGASIAKTINGLLSALRSFVKTKPFKSVGQAVIDAIVGFFTTFDWNNLGSTLNALLTGLLNALKDTIKTIKWEEIPQYIVNSIDQFLAGLKIDEVFKSAIEAVQAAISAIINILTGKNEDTTNLNEKNPIIEALGRLKERLGAILDIDFEAIAVGFHDMVTALTPAVEGFAAGFLDVLNLLFKIGIEFFNALGPALQTIADSFSDMNPEFLEGVGKALGTIVAALLVINVLTGVAGIITGIGTALTTWIAPLTTLVGRIGGAVSGAASGAAAAAPGLLGGFLSTVLKLTGAVGAFTITMEKNILVISDEDKDVARLNQEWDENYEVTKNVAKQMGLTDESADQLATTVSNMTNEVYNNNGLLNDANTLLAENGISTDTFSSALRNAKTEAEGLGLNVDGINSYLDTYNSNTSTGSTNTDTLTQSIENLDTASAEADTATTGVGNAIKDFNGLSISAPLKLALIAGAIQWLKRDGKLSQEQSEKLQKTLDNYDETHPVESMNNIAQAFEDAGVSTDDFTLAIGKATKRVDTTTKNKIKDWTDRIKDFGFVLGTEGKKGGKNFNKGLTEGLEDETEVKAVETASKSVIEDAVIGTAKKTAAISSPSKKMKTIGEDLLRGLKNGIDAQSPSVTKAINQLISNLTTAISNKKATFNTLGKNLTINLKNGINSGKETVKLTMSSLATAIKNAFKDAISWGDVGADISKELYNGLKESIYTTMYLESQASIIAGNIYNEINGAGWYTLGGNIGLGIYNGLIAENDDLETLAWNTAVGMYNSACEALGIESPSKKFAWIGEMTMEGLSEGISDNERSAVSAVDDMVDSMTKHAYGLQAISNASAITMPPIVQGKVIPNSTKAKASEDKLDTIMGALSALNNNWVTRDELADLLKDLAQNVQAQFYIGDEQIARHANAGNARLNRRYKTT